MPTWTRTAIYYGQGLIALRVFSVFSVRVWDFPRWRHILKLWAINSSHVCRTIFVDLITIITTWTLHLTFVQLHTLQSLVEIFCVFGPNSCHLWNFLDRMLWFYSLDRTICATPLLLPRLSLILCYNLWTTCTTHAGLGKLWWCKSYRHTARNPRKRHNLNIDSYNTRVNTANLLLTARLSNVPYGVYHKHKGLFGTQQLEASLSDDGVHLNNLMGYKKYFHNIRGAITSTLRQL